MFQDGQYYIIGQRTIAGIIVVKQPTRLTITKQPLIIKREPQFMPTAIPIYCIEHHFAFDNKWTEPKISQRISVDAITLCTYQDGITVNLP